ncbi:MAG: S41 family peptidase [Phycisphaerales bacterium]
MIVGTAAALCGCASTPQAAVPTMEPVAAGAAIVQHVREQFYDANAAAAWAERHRGLGADCDASTWPRTAAAALAELRASHTAYLAPDDPGNVALRAIFAAPDEPVVADSIGIDAVAIDGRWFVLHVARGSSADAMGVLRGDEIVSCNGAPFHPTRSIAGQRAVRVALRRHEGDAPVERTLGVRRSPLRATWLDAQRAGTRVERVGDVAVGVVPIWCGAGDEYREALEEAIRGSLRDADALVLDLRDGYGGCSPEWARMFAPDVPTIASTDRDGRTTTYDAQWRKPLVVVINRGTRSGKEVLARSLQRHGQATLVGERSAGAVLGGRLFELPDGGVLYLATQDVRVDGERIEGVGVPPDVAVTERVEYASGADAMLEHAIAVAADKVRAARDPGTLPTRTP